MSRPRADRRPEILAQARALLRSEGLAGLTFEAVAQRLGLTRQAVIYWYPSKEHLLAEVVLVVIREESEALQRAVQGAADPGDAVRAVLRAMLDHHGAAGWEELRVIYMSTQLVAEHRRLLGPEDRAAHLYPTTAAFYAAFEEALRPAAGPQARRLAVAVHMAGLGLATMAGLQDSIGDRMAEPMHDYADALADLLARGLSAPVEGAGP